MNIIRYVGLTILAVTCVYYWATSTNKLLWLLAAAIVLIIVPLWRGRK